MSVLVTTGRGLYFTGDGGADWLCGRCGRLLALNIAEGQIQNLWLTCPKCRWLNGFDIDLGWARYVVRELEDRKLSLERIEQLLADLRDESATPEQFLAQNPDVAHGPIGWLARISLTAVITVLTLLYAIYSGERSAQIVREQARVAKEQVELQRKAAGGKGDALSLRDIENIAQRLHDLQQTVQIKPPPKPPRSKTKRPRP
jgi:phage FluMu protein Com